MSDHYRHSGKFAPEGPILGLLGSLAGAGRGFPQHRDGPNGYSSSFNVSRFYYLK